MLPSINEKLDDEHSIFSLVIAVAKRARDINDKNEREKKFIMEGNSGKLPQDLPSEKKFLNVKPVKLAIDEYLDGDFTFKMNR